MPKWTDEQYAAITTKDCDLLVAAAAGSGKTAVLVERIISTILDEKNNTDIDNLLIVTYTNAAAAEMRQRISDAISEKLAAYPESIHLQRQLMLLNKASITTVHSFCLNIVRQNFNLLDIDPSFRIAEENELLLTKSETLDELFEILYDEEDSNDFLSLVEIFGTNTKDNAFSELILEIYDFIQSSPFPKKWLEDMTVIYKTSSEINFNETLWAKIAMKAAYEQVDYALLSCNEVLNICLLPNGPEAYVNTIYSDMEKLNHLKLYIEKGYSHLYEAFSMLKFDKLPSRQPKDVSAELKKAAQDIRNSDVKKMTDKLSGAFFFKPADEMKEDIDNLYKTVDALAKVVMLFIDSFRQAKKQKNIIDYNDMEHYCLELLCEEGSTEDLPIPSSIARELQLKYKEIYIDEYQDSNYIQEMILSVVSKKIYNSPNRFMVGDIKQSIYKFRQAAPELFLQKYLSYNGDNTTEKKIDLFKNFRSRESVLSFVNHIFKQIMTAESCGIEYNKTAALYPGATFPKPDSDEIYISNNTDILLFELDADDTSDELEFDNIEEMVQLDELNELNKTEKEARLVATKIQELMEQNNGLNIYDSEISSYRKLQYKDIVILLRSANRLGNIYATELLKCGIGAYTDTSSGYFDTLEIKTFLSLLQIIDNPRQDIHLITVLYSPMFSIDCDQLIEIRTFRETGTFYDCIIEYISKAENDLKYRLQAILDKLNSYRDLAVFQPISEFVSYLLSDTNYYNFVIGLPGGVIRQANLDALKERAVKYERSSFNGLFNFIRYVEKIKTYSKNAEEAKVLNKNQNLVKIMSIHKSKGLEFPVVFVCGLANTFNLTDLNKKLLMHREMGFGLDYTDYEKRVKYSTITRNAISKKTKDEILAEEIRILYVALTRAKEKLILTACVKNIDNLYKKWNKYLAKQSNKLPAFYILNCRNYLDWIMPAALKKPEIESENFFDSLPSINIQHKSRQELSIKKQQNTKNKEVHEEFKNIDTTINYSEYKNAIMEKINWKYIHSQQTELPASISISEIKKQWQTDIDYMETTMSSKQYNTPNFLKSEIGITPMEKGTLIHTVMRHLDFKNPNISDQLNVMLVKGIISKTEIEHINIKNISKFLQSDICSRINESKVVYKEKPFVLGVEPNEIYLDMPAMSNDTLLVHGIIDCVFEEDEQFVIVDYKTDKAANSEIVSRYSIQLNIYAKALKNITGKETKQKVIFLYETGKEIII